MNIYNYLKNKEYPGRGIIVGMSNNHIILAYFIMGRSENSKNRIFVYDNDSLYTKAYDEAKVKDPSLIIYRAYNKYNDKLILSNGDQTDTILEFLKLGKSFKDALDTRMFEPDMPNYTPRISAMVDINKKEYQISILRNSLKDGITCERKYYKYDLVSKKAHFISTYIDNDNPLPSFDCDPIEIEINDDIDDFTNKIYDSLNNDNKISLFTQYININDNSIDTRIINKNK